MKRSRTGERISLTMLGVAVLGVGGIAIAASIVPTAEAASSVDVDGEALAQVSSEFAQPQERIDELPPFLLGERGLPDLLPATSRLVGANEKANFFVAADNDGNACLVIVRPDEWTAQTCLPPERASETGLVLQLIDIDANDGGLRAVLLPESLTFDGADSAVERLTDHLVVGRADVSAERIEAKDSNGNIVEVETLDAITE